MPAYKKCPECGEDAALWDETCIRCEHRFRTQFDDEGDPVAPGDESPVRMGTPEPSRHGGRLMMVTLAVIALSVAALCLCRPSK